MSAFGSFADKTIIDFRRISGGLFLVTGDTGAGKTTIFDAITYALYGQTSGGKRDGNMMRSQYADEEKETYVELVFSYRGEEYCIRRNPEYFRLGKRKHADGTPRYVKETSKVELTLPDGKVFVGKKKETDQKIVEIMGMDVEQFTQIAMIAQGDFLKLLHAESKERRKIFSRIFQTKYYFQVQETMKNQAASLSLQLQDNSNDCKREMERVVMRNDFVHEERWNELKKLPVPVKDETQELLSQLCKEDEKDEKTVEKTLDSCQKKLESVSKIIPLLNALAEAEREKENLKASETYIAVLEKEVSAIKQAEKIVPLKTAIGQTKHGIDKTLKQNQELEKARGIYKEQIHAKKQELDYQQGILETKEPDWTRQILKMKESLDAYDRLDKIQKELRIQEKAHTHKTETAERLAVKKQICEKQITEARQIIEKNKSADVRRLQWKLLYEQKAEQKSAMENLIKRQKELKEFYTVCIQLKEKTEISRSRYLEAAAKYEKVYLTFLNEQAGILAQGLQEGMPCPVCGSLSHPDKSKVAGNAPTQKEVEEIKRLREELEIQRDQAATQYQENAQRYTVEYQTFSAKLSEIMGDRCNDSSEVIQDFYRELCEEKETLFKEIESAEKEIAQKEKAEESLKILEEQLEIVQKQIDEEKENIQNIATEIQRLKTEYKARAEGLIFADKAEAVKVLEEKKTKLKIQKELVAKLRSECQTLQEMATHADGQFLANRKSLEEMSDRLQKEETVFAQALIENNIKEEELNTFLEKLNSLQEKEKTVENHHKMVQINEGRISSLREQTTGFSTENLSGLQLQKEKLETEEQSLKEQQMHLNAAIRNNRECLSQLTKKFAASEELRQKYEIISNLSKTANGNLTGSIKLDFETYVQRRYFRQIIQAANKRLIQMTGGEFLLECRNVKSLGNQGQAGLDLDVYHVVSDTTRDVKTLSGGESFMASLSMALGLADIVQNAAGGIRLETMFVDEGFGSLDDVAREQAIKVLVELAGTDRIVGIISHVNELKEQIDTKLMVRKTEKGSRVQWMD